ncbi:MAG: hypothetical protein CM15mP85_13020 [Rhodobacterales bacterium]|nr:MAG: hypothetical protein CM15mP85_13020 [Rhodobacterales bacterium]
MGLLIRLPELSTLSNPTEAQMAKPTYATAFGRVAEDAVKEMTIQPVASRTSDMDITVESGALKLDTGKFNFQKVLDISWSSYSK